MKNVSIQRDRIWSATPTPFTADGRVDAPSVQRMVAHHVDLGVAGMMLAGTCGEGPWLRDCDREVLARTAVEAARGKIQVHVTVPTQNGWKAIALSAGARQELFISTTLGKEALELALEKAAV